MGNTNLYFSPSLTTVNGVDGPLCPHVAASATVVLVTPPVHINSLTG